MIKLYNSGVYLVNKTSIVPDDADARAQMISLIKQPVERNSATRGTITYSILKSHNTTEDMNSLKLRFDSIASHDLTYVGIIQTAKASGMDKFSIPYVLTNCHNSLCAVGGTINEDDHMFGLSAAKKYGGIYVPPHMAIIHMYMREMMAGCGKMILGSDSHTRYGALGTMGIGEGGGELVKQLLDQSYDIAYPRVIGIYLTGKPHPSVGPQDVALAIIGATFKNGYVKNSVMEFIGDGIANLSTDYRCAIDVMTTETACLSSIWETDTDTKEFFEIHGRPKAFQQLQPMDVAYYDGMVYVDLSKIKPMIALPFHPSNVYEIDAFNEAPADILRQVELNGEQLMENKKVPFNLTDKLVHGRLKVDQAVIAGCSGGTYTNIMAAKNILKGYSIGSGELALSVYPSSQPVMLELTKNGTMTDLMKAGAVIRTAFCGPCFGAGDVPTNGGLSIRHTTRNFPNREGSKPANRQIASVALMDSRSIAATVVNGGYLTSATTMDAQYESPRYFFDKTPYINRVYDGFGKPEPSNTLRYGPNIVDWPEFSALPENLLLKVVSFITDLVTSTDELIPSGETSSYRSNPIGLAEFALSRKDPAYVERAKAVQQAEKRRQAGNCPGEEFTHALQQIQTISGYKPADWVNTGIGSTIYAVKPGDGSAREQAASCQRVLGGCANIVKEYATKRYCSNLINWGMIPFVLDGEPEFENGDIIFVPEIRKALTEDCSEIKAYRLSTSNGEFVLHIAKLTQEEKEIILAGSLINYNRNHL